MRGLLAQHRHRRIRAGEDEIVRARTGTWREEHLFVLGQALGMYDDIARYLDECDRKLQALLAECTSGEVELGKQPREGTKTRAEFDARQALANWTGVDLTRINGLGLDSVMKILSEIGPDLSRFANVNHFCSWLGLCPSTKISGGKVLSLGRKRSANRTRQVHGARYASHAAARADLFDYIELFYNRSRRHSALGYVSPPQYLQHSLAAQA